MGAKLLIGINDLATTHPELASQFDGPKNAPITPVTITAGTNKLLWWLCQKGHSFQTSGDKRIRGRGCPYCSNKAVLVGYNDLAITNPEVAAQWHPSLNGDLTPKDVVEGSRREVWWQCSKGHAWAATPHTRVSGHGCGVCSNRVLVVGANDLATTNPTLAAQWDHVRNGTLKPTDIVEGSNHPVWWLCELGHSWEVAPVHRLKGNGCPYCGGQRLLAGFNDLATSHPEIAVQWDYERNAPTTPSEVISGKTQKFWWRCSRAHEWQATINSRKMGSDCPVCHNLTLLVGYNDFETTHPEVAASWHPIKNGARTPKEFIAASGERFWWVCDKGHEWQISITARKTGNGCPICDMKRLVVGVNDLATLYPDVAASWNSELNGLLSPEQVLGGGNKKFWWSCPQGHHWKKSVGGRIAGHGCPVCHGTQLLTGFNDLATTHPEIARQWHATKNLPRTPESVNALGRTKVWWVCEQAHEWQAVISSRKQGIGCPVCSNLQFLEGVNDFATLHPELLPEWHPTKNGRLKPNKLNGGGANRQVWWRCVKGHEWRTNASSRISGRGCPSCAVFGYDSTREGILYFIEHSTYKARKIGITNLVNRGDRIADFKELGWTEVKTWVRGGQVIRDAETTTLRWIRKDLGLPQFLGKEEMGPHGGQTETFSNDGPSNLEVIEKVELVLANLHEA
jgi:hypothetical protein